MSKNKSQQLNALAICIQISLPVLLWGSPGIGKTTTTVAIAEYLKLLCEVVIASLREPSDFAGLPIINSAGDSVKLAPPAWAMRLSQAAKGMLFLDEISTAPPAVQAALLRVVLDKVVGDLPLPPNISIVASANPPDEAASGWDLSAPLANRFVHLSWTLNAKEWATGMRNGWTTEDVVTVPDNWELNLPTARTLVANFIERQPHLLHKMPKDESLMGRAWPSPRTWDMASRILAACQAAKVDDEITALLISGAVGEAATITFTDYLRELDLPNPEMLIAAPSLYKFPQGRSDKIYAILYSVVAAILRENTVDRYYAGQKVLSEAARQGFTDLAYPLCTSLMKKVPVGANPVIAEMNIFSEIRQQVGQI